MRTLHIYGQAYWHEPVMIVGTPDAFIALQEALHAAVNLACAGAPDITTPMFVSDGEGFEVIIRVETAEAMDTYAVPYTDACAAERREPAPESQWPKICQ